MDARTMGDDAYDNEAGIKETDSAPSRHDAGTPADASEPADANAIDAGPYDAGLPCVTASAENCVTFGPPGPVCAGAPPLCVAAGYNVLWSAQTSSCVAVMAASGSASAPYCIPISNPDENPVVVDKTCLITILTDTEAGEENVCYRLELVPQTGVGSFDAASIP
jgi:hypothetical protein